jgi:hypothetical protein
MALRAEAACKDRAMIEITLLGTVAQPGKTQVYLQVRSVSVRFIPARYLRFCSRVLTASRAATHFPELPVS